MNDQYQVGDEVMSRKSYMMSVFNMPQKLFPVVSPSIPGSPELSSCFHNTFCRLYIVEKKAFFYNLKMQYLSLFLSTLFAAASLASPNPLAAIKDRAVGDSCKASEGSGSCQNTSNCQSKISTFH